MRTRAERRHNDVSKARRKRRLAKELYSSGGSDWEWFDKMLEKFHLKDFISCINAICVENLGFDAGIYKRVRFNPLLKDRILSDILYPEFEAASPKYIVPRLIYKYRRWQGNAWKQELCFSESRLEIFFSGIWAKILKPASI